MGAFNSEFTGQQIEDLLKKINAQYDKSALDELISGLSKTNHTHTEYADVDHTHTGYAGTDHNHNDLYFTKEEITQKLAAVAPTLTPEQLEAITAEIVANFDLSNYYTKEEVDNKVGEVSNITIDGFFFKNDYFETASHYGLQGWIKAIPGEVIKLKAPLSMPNNLGVKQAVLIKKTDAINFGVGIKYYSYLTPTKIESDDNYKYFHYLIPDTSDCTEPLYFMWLNKAENIVYDIIVSYADSDNISAKCKTPADVNIVSAMINSRAVFYAKQALLTEFVKTLHTFTNFELTINYNGRPLSLHGNNFISKGLIPTTIGSTYRITFDTYDGQQLSRAGIGVINGRTARSLADGTFVPSGLTEPIEEIIGGPWAITLANAKINAEKTRGELTFTIPSNLDGSDGLYLVWTDTFLHQHKL